MVTELIWFKFLSKISVISYKVSSVLLRQNDRISPVSNVKSSDNFDKDAKNKINMYDEQKN